MGRGSDSHLRLSMFTSHRTRVQEKKFFRRLIFTIGLLFTTFLFLLFVGLPLFARFILTLSSLRPAKPASNTSATASFLFPPFLDPSFEATNSGKLTLTGSSEKEATVKLFINDKDEVKVLADNEGKFVVKNIKLHEGTNTITAVTIKENKESSPSSPLIITYKKNPPKLEISSPKEGATFSSDQKEMILTGETESGSRVTINDRFVIVDQRGKFTYTAQLSNGENTFKAVAGDSAGNQTTVERKVTFTQ